mmetsp:Transcript_2163/g.5348  ORF Transcript_2163/g.5348 Transcript_2163/m.5348 type:complete len:284 (-) Transcript_2163:166-1017(-)
MDFAATVYNFASAGDPIEPHCYNYQPMWLHVVQGIVVAMFGSVGIRQGLGAVASGKRQLPPLARGPADAFLCAVLVAIEVFIIFLRLHERTLVHMCNLCHFVALGNILVLRSDRHWVRTLYALFVIPHACCALPALLLPDKSNEGWKTIPYYAEVFYGHHVVLLCIPVYIALTRGWPVVKHIFEGGLIANMRTWGLAGLSIAWIFWFCILTGVALIFRSNTFLMLCPPPNLEPIFAWAGWFWGIGNKIVIGAWGMAYTLAVHLLVVACQRRLPSREPLSAKSR